MPDKIPKMLNLGYSSFVSKIYSNFIFSDDLQTDQQLLGSGSETSEYLSSKEVEKLFHLPAPGFMAKVCLHQLVNYI